MRLPNHSDKEYRAILNKGNEAGIPPVEVLKMATSQNARILDMQDRIGTIEKGKFADLIAIKGNPLNDLDAMDNVYMVMKGGNVIGVNKKGSSD